MRLDVTLIGLVILVSLPRTICALGCVAGLEVSGELAHGLLWLVTAFVVVFSWIKMFLEPFPLFQLPFPLFQLGAEPPPGVIPATPRVWD